MELVLSKFDASHIFNNSREFGNNIENFAGELSSADIAISSRDHGDFSSIGDWGSDFQSNLKYEINDDLS